jgi:hypothetical protein
MWVKFKITYAGPLGLFTAGTKMDLTKEKIAAIRKKIGDENVVDTCAPWDEGVDMKAAKHNAFLEKVHNAIAKAENLTDECWDIAIAIEKLQDSQEQKVKECDNAVKKAKKLAKTAGIDWPL